jgi:hypothetical protein
MRAWYAACFVVGLALVSPRGLFGTEPLAEPLAVGFAETDITPPLGFPMAGYYHERLATGTHDPLKAKAIVFRQGAEQAALVVCDVTGIAHDLSVEVRRRVAKETGIAAENIILSATHSHTAPDYTGDLYDYLADPAAGSDRYSATLIEQIVQAIVAAHDGAAPVAVSAGTAIQEAPVSFNRRFVMKDGSVRTWQSLGNPEVVRAAGPIDPEMGLLLCRTEDGRPVGVLSSFALHLDTVGGTEWSADYPFHIEQSLRRALGEELISVFGTGCCGDINHVDPAETARNSCEVIGQSLGATIEAALPALEPVAQPRLRVRTATVPLPLQEVAMADLQRAPALLKLAARGEQVDFFEVVAAHKAVILDHLRNSPPVLRTPEHISWGLSHAWSGVGDALPVEVQVIALGDDVAIVLLPGEVFVDLGLAIKQGSPFRTTLIIELSNCVETIYIPTRAAYAGGSYEVLNSSTQPGSGEALVEAALRLLRSAADGT